MPYKINTFLNPSEELRQNWSLVPQVRTLTLAGHKTKSLYAALSPSIPIFYVLMFLAISFDIYLGFSILAKQGVNIGLIIGSVIADFFLAIAPFLFESNFSGKYNHIKLENQIFQKKLECMTMRNNETEEEFDGRRSHTIEPDLKEYESNKSKGNVLRIVLIFLIFAIAGWKIYTFYKVLPPGISIFSVINGKIVIIFSLLCAIFHIIGSEKAFAHFMFWRRKRSEVKRHRETHDGKRPKPKPSPINYVGKYENAEAGNTSVINKDGKVYLEYIYIIKDDEIYSLINDQTDDDAKRGIAIQCKQIQFV